MSEPLKGSRGIVHCDSCGHEIADQLVREWAHKSCPMCNAPDIVNDADIAILDVLDSLVHCGLLTQDGTAPGVDIYIDTAGLRNRT